MKIGVLGWDYEEVETLSLVEIGQKMGHEVLLFTLQDIRFEASSSKGVQLFAHGQPLLMLDTIIPRAQLRPTHWRTDVEMLTALDYLGVPMLDRAEVFACVENKLLILQRLAQAGLPIPDTYQCKTLEQVKEIWQRYGHIVVKPSCGFSGYGVEQVKEDFEKQGPVIEHLLTNYGDVLVEPFISHPQGDIRTTVVGDHIVFSVRRIPNKKTWKANIGQGADFILFDPPERVREISLRAAQVMGIKLAGMDILEYNGDYCFLEVNNCPGWYFLTKEQQDDVAQEVITYALEHTCRRPLAGKVLLEG